jgi:hypothetical protein
MPPECVDLTLDSDEDDYGTQNTSRGKRRTPSPDSDVVLVVDDGPRERKKQCTQAQAAAADDQDDDVVLESVTGTVSSSNKRRALAPNSAACMLSPSHWHSIDVACARGAAGAWYACYRWH